MNIRTATSVSPHWQRGVSLLVVLVLLLVSTILGLAVLRSTAMQERMTANLRDRSIAFQATEAALRYAENQVVGNADLSTSFPADNAACATRSTVWVCGRPVVAALDRWLNSSTTWAQVPNTEYDTVLVAQAPEYIVEYMGKVPSRPGGCDVAGSSDRAINCDNPMYRITARTRALGRAEVMLQSNVINRIVVP